MSPGPSPPPPASPIIASWSIHHHYYLSLYLMLIPDASAPLLWIFKGLICSWTCVLLFTTFFSSLIMNNMVLRDRETQLKGTSLFVIVHSSWIIWSLWVTRLNIVCVPPTQKNKYWIDLFLCCIRISVDVTEPFLVRHYCVHILLFLMVSHVLAGTKHVLCVQCDCWHFTVCDESSSKEFLVPRGSRRVDVMRCSLPSWGGKRWPLITLSVFVFP